MFKITYYIKKERNILNVKNITELEHALIATDKYKNSRMVVKYV